MSKGGVAIGYCHPGEVAGMFHESLVQLLIHDSRGPRRVVEHGDVISMASGPRIASARNMIADTFMRHPARPDWLWMVDSDMTFRADTLDRLVETATDNQLLILGGLCFGGGRSGACFPTLFRLDAPDDEGKVVQVIEDYPKDALVRVDATGAACLLIHRLALSRIHAIFGEVDTPQGRVKSPAPWFAETFYAGREFGEDWTFCMRAAQADIPIHVHTGIALGHVKPTILDETAWEDYKVKRDDLGSREAVVNAFRQRAMGSNIVAVG